MYYCLIISQSVEFYLSRIYTNGMGKRILTGIKPTGDMTLGNYIGAIMPLLELQEKGDDIFLFVADLHALTIPQDVSLLRDRIRKFVAMYLACGVDPEKVTVYVQSDNEYIPCISWILECNTSYGEASRMIQFKEKSKGSSTFSVGLLTYPVLMAADILYCDTDYVPVGVDQRQHVELARYIAEKFNSRYGETFKLPEAMLREGAKVRDLKDPAKKMSKSEDSPNGVISLFDEKDEIIRKIMGATTDSDSSVRFDEESKPGISNLLLISSVMESKPISDIESRFDGKSYAEFKRYVAETTSEKISKIQEKYHAVLQDGDLDNLLKKGADISRDLAKKKYSLMCERVGLGI